MRTRRLGQRKLGVDGTRSVRRQIELRAVGDEFARERISAGHREPGRELDRSRSGDGAAAEFGREPRDRRARAVEAQLRRRLRDWRPIQIADVRSAGQRSMPQENRPLDRPRNADVPLDRAAQFGVITEHVVQKRRIQARDVNVEADRLARRSNAEGRDFERQRSGQTHLAVRERRAGVRDFELAAVELHLAEHRGNGDPVGRNAAGVHAGLERRCPVGSSDEQGRFERTRYRKVHASYLVGQSRQIVAGRVDLQIERLRRAQSERAARRRVQPRRHDLRAIDRHPRSRRMRRNRRLLERQRTERAVLDLCAAAQRDQRVSSFHRSLTRNAAADRDAGEARGRNPKRQIHVAQRRR